MNISVKKVLATIAVVFVSCSAAFATGDLLLFENFEGGIVPPDGWDSVVTVPAYTWQIEHRVGYYVDGIYSAICPWQASETQDEWLISPVVNLTDYSGATLSFYWYGSTYYADNANLHIMVSTDGSNYDDVWEIPYHSDGHGSHNWTFQIVDLSAYAGSPNVYVGFRYYGRNGDSVIIDVITLAGGTLPVESSSFGRIKTIYK
ncbi:MAG: choice-of-anchor J domain-containing protein [Candidatus Coatesbacteria bacterium]|nr:MAG: choice-of-anchor J domain-containing protein [Candidatus Coatesbacteria bacterium]